MGEATTGSAVDERIVVLENRTAAAEDALATLERHVAAFELSRDQLADFKHRTLKDLLMVKGEMAMATGQPETSAALDEAEDRIRRADYRILHLLRALESSND